MSQLCLTPNQWRLCSKIDWQLTVMAWLLLPKIEFSIQKWCRPTVDPLSRSRPCSSERKLLWLIHAKTPSSILTRSKMMQHSKINYPWNRGRNSRHNLTNSFDRASRSSNPLSQKRRNHRRNNLSNHPKKRLQAPTTYSSIRASLTNWMILSAFQ